MLHLVLYEVEDNCGPRHWQVLNLAYSEYIQVYRTSRRKIAILSATAYRLQGMKCHKGFRAQRLRGRLRGTISPER
jgi:hypothetical protein